MSDEGVRVSAHGLNKSYDGGLVRALVDVDLEIAPGEKVAIIGPTGSGKSTLLALLSMLESADGGTIELDGVPTTSIRSPERWRSIHLGLVFQLHHLLGHLTAVENVMLPLIGDRHPPSDARRQAQTMLEGLGLAHRADTLAAHLSGGERQVTSVARAVINDPRLVLADEPTGNVDSETGARILDILADWSTRRGGSLITVTHDGEVASRSDRVVRLRDGRIEGTDHEIAP